MSGPQFAHIQTWSMKANKAGQSISQIIAEATRDPEYSTHVEAPAPPRLILGDPETFAADHADHVAARSTRVQMPDGSERVRAIRRDRHTMASIVMSYPVPLAAIRTQADCEKLARWEQRNLDWLRDTYGDQLKVVMAHDDEAHPHLHAWLLADDPGADATTLHPGKVAKRRAEAEAKAEGVPPREAVKIGNRALRAAMTEWQNTYHEAVGAPEGLTRSGPKRRRLTREQWRAEKETARANAATLGRANDADARAAELIDQAQADANQILADAEAKAVLISAKAAAVVAAVVALSEEVSAGTLGKKDGKVIAAHPDRIRPGLPEIRPALHGAADAAEAIRTERASLATERAELEQQRGQLAQLADKLREAIGKALQFARRPGTPVVDQVEAARMKKHAAGLLQEVQKASPPPEDPLDDPDGPGF